MNKLQNKDCLQFLSKLKDNSVDLVLTEPPSGSGKKYLSWCMKWTTECVRVLKPNGMMIVWGTLKNESFLVYKYALNRDKQLTEQHEIVWECRTGRRSKKNFAHKHQYAWCYSKGKDFTYRNNSDDYTCVHSSTSRQSLDELLINAYTVPGDTVLDIFVGDGSTAVSAKKVGRQYWGCESDSALYQQAKQRINKATTLQSVTGVLQFV